MNIESIVRVLTEPADPALLTGENGAAFGRGWNACRDSMLSALIESAPNATRASADESAAAFTARRISNQIALNAHRLILEAVRASEKGST